MAQGEKKFQIKTYFKFRNVIEMCLKFKVTRLVYTSSYNVIFSNKSLENIDESEPYPDDKDQYDYYSRSKKAAELLLLEYDGTRLGKSLGQPYMIPNDIFRRWKDA